MVIRSAEIVGSFPSLAACPPPDRPEYAFCGRSNVGKSSLINALLKRKIARTSATPGKTQLLNYYHINDSWYLVDLPGYGYAKVSQKMRRQWQKLIKDYLQLRQSLVNVFALVDGMIPPQNIDLEFMETLGRARVPFSIVFTKTDRIKPRHFEQNRRAFEAKMLEKWETLPPVFVTSAKTGAGTAAITDYIAQINEQVANEFDG